MAEGASLAVILAVYLFAGVGKGVVGLGLPTVTVALLVPVTGLAPAVALTVVPTLVTNVWQALTGGRLVAIVRRLWPLLALAAFGCQIGTSILANADTTKLTAALGVLLVLYAALALTTPPLPEPGRREPWLGPLTGLGAGLVAGSVGSFTLPTVVYLQALKLPRDMLVQALGVIFSTLSLSVGAGLARAELLSPPLLALSVLAVVPAVLGMEVGRRVRTRLPEALFRKVFLWALMALGLQMSVRAFL